MLLGNNRAKNGHGRKVSDGKIIGMIQKLEKELGTQLFDRIGKRIYLNDAGKRFLTHATISMNELHEARKSLAIKTDKEIKGHITIGMFTSALLIMDCLFSYSKEYPFVNFTIDSIVGQEQSPATQTLEPVMHF